MTEVTQKGNQLARGERLQVMIHGEELAALDDFRFNNRMPSRAAAVRELLRRGLAATGYAMDEKRGASTDYGVTSGYSGDDDAASVEPK